MTLDRWINCKESYDTRIKLMASFIKEGTSVLDIGCGQEALKRYIPSNVIYTGCDLIQRSEHTIVCDFNKLEYPPFKNYDYIFCSGVLEYINDLQYFLFNIQKYGTEFIFSYAPNFTDVESRLKHDWVNHYTLTDLHDLLDELNYKVIKHTGWGNQLILHLTKIK